VIAELLRIRQATFQRISDEALDDAKMTKAVLTAIRYKEKEAVSAGAVVTNAVRADLRAP
jgi:hypothetical protein